MVNNELTDRLLRAAIELAASGGPDAVVLREVARQAGVAASSVYKHYTDVELLRIHVRTSLEGYLAGWLENELLEEFGPEPAPATAGALQDRLAFIAREHCQHARDEPGNFAMAYWAPVRPAQTTDQQDLGAEHLLTGVVHKQFEEWLATEVRGEDVDRVVLLAVTAIQGLAWRCGLGDLRTAPMRLLQEYAASLAEALVAHLIRAGAPGDDLGKQASSSP